MTSSLCLKLREAGAFAPAYSLNTITTQLYTFCGLASVFTSSDPCRNCPPPSPLTADAPIRLTNSNNSPTHSELQAALRPCGGGRGWSKLKHSKNHTEHYGPCSTDSPFFPFDLLLSPPVHSTLVGTGGNSSSNIGHTLTRERKIQAISTKSEICCDVLIYMSYHHTVNNYTNNILLMFFGF